MTTFFVILFCVVLFVIAFVTTVRFFIDDFFRKDVIRDYGDEIRILKKDEIEKSFSRNYFVTRFYVQISFLGIWFDYDFEHDPQTAQSHVASIRQYRTNKANLKNSIEVINKEKL